MIGATLLGKIDTTPQSENMANARRETIRMSQKQDFDEALAGIQELKKVAHFVATDAMG